jgi:hypothetical protein
MASLLINGEIWVGGGGGGGAPHKKKIKLFLKKKRNPTKYKLIRLIMQKLANLHSIWLH